MPSMKERIAALTPLQRRQLKETLERRAKPQTGHPLSDMQWNLWFEHLLEPTSPGYNIGFPLRILSAYDKDCVRRAFQYLLRRHASLRTVYGGDRDNPTQAAVDELEVPFEVVDAAALGEAEIRARMQRAYEIPFDLGVGPLIRVTLFERQSESVLFSVVHHIATDLWSVGVLVREFKRVYDALVAKRSPDLGEVAEYTDFIRRQRALLNGDEGRRSWEYWSRQLERSNLDLRLPTDRPRLAIQTIENATHVFAFDAELTRRLRAFAQWSGRTLYTVLLAVFNVLIHRYTGADDIVVGSPASNRADAAFNNTVGCFANIIALRADLADDPSFTSLLDRLHATVLGALENQAFPFGELTRRLKLKLNPGRTMLTQVGFSLDRIFSVVGEAEPGTLRLAQMLFPNQQSGPLDIFLNVADHGDTLYGALRYKVTLFDEATAERMADSYRAILADAIDRPDAPVSRLAIMGAEQRERVLFGWNRTSAPLPSVSLVHQLVEDQARRTPHAVAASCQGEQLTYAALDQGANHVAHELRSSGVGDEAIVAVLAERGLDLLTSMLGILKAGATYLPLDPRSPLARNLQILRQSRAAAALAGDGFLEELSDQGREAAGTLRRILPLAETCKARREEPPAVTIAPGSRAYAIYTSGSTGTPKGAMIEHRGMLNHVRAKVEALALGDDDVVAQTASQCFDISVWQLLSILVVGGRVEIIPDATVRDLRLFAGEVLDRGVTILEVVPSVLQQLLALRAGSAPASLSLRWLLTTGEAVPPELARAWLSRYPSIPLLNAYGPTECSDDVTHHVIKEPPAADEVTVPIGRPLPNTQLYVLDDAMEPVAVGVVGELYVGGIGVGRGYLDDPRRTAAAFTPDPFGGLPGARLYRTGDRARYRPSGDVEFLGRADRQVKVRGFRVEPGEIEAVLCAHPSVGQAAVVLQQGSAGQHLLVGYLSPARPGAAVDTAALRAHTAALLPDYMVPAKWVAMDRLPTNTNGKIDRKSLGDAVPTAPEEAQEPPRNAVEELVASTWCELLHLDRVGARDDFFELGGDSLLATRAIGTLNSLLGIEVPIRAIFEHSCVSDLAQGLATYEPTAGHVEATAKLRLRLAKMSPEEIRAGLQARRGSAPETTPARASTLRRE